MKVWIAGHGEYSDARNLGIFTSKETAERLSKLYPLDWVEEFELNEWPPRVEDRTGEKFYIVFIRLRDGNIDLDQEDPEEREGVFYNKALSYRLQIDPHDPGDLVVRTWARDEEHATKIAVEKKQAWLREHAHELGGGA